MRIIIANLLALSSLALAAPDPIKILKDVDANTFSSSVHMTTSMIVHGERSTRTMKSESWSEADKRSFTEFLSPPREKGVKMLKISDALWTFYPSADRVIKIAGHMLRQSLMGSDLSYEDMMEDRKLIDIYNAEYVGSESLDGRPCYILKLTAKSEDIAYQQRKIWVDSERAVVLKEELFAKSGKALKRISVNKVEKISDRWYPTHLLFKDLLQNGEGTELIIHKIDFDVKIPEDRFSINSLRR